MGSPYRRKQVVYDNMPEGQREVYSVAIGDTGAVGTVRPSAGSAAAAGAGSLSTVSRLNTGIYRLVFAQTYFKNAGTQVTLRSPYSLDGSTRQNLTVQATAYDATTNAVLVYVLNPTTGALADPASGSLLSVEQFWIESVSPATA